MKVRRIHRERYGWRLHYSASAEESLILIPCDQYAGKVARKRWDEYLFLGNRDYRQYRHGKLRILTGVYPKAVLGIDPAIGESQTSVTFAYDYSVPHGSVELLEKMRRNVAELLPPIRSVAPEPPTTIEGVLRKWADIVRLPLKVDLTLPDPSSKINWDLHLPWKLAP